MDTAVEEVVHEEPVAPPPIIVPSPPLGPIGVQKWPRWLLAAGLLLALGAGLIVWRAHVGAAISYETVPVERGPIQASVTATGTLNAVVSVQVGSQVSGNIKALYADYNTKVTKGGQLVALIDPALFEAQVSQAQAGPRESLVLGSVRRWTHLLGTEPGVIANAIPPAIKDSSVLVGQWP